MHTLSRWVLLASAGTLLLLLGGRLTAYITPGEFLGIGPTTIVSDSAASSSVTSPPIPILFGQSSSSTSSTYLLPILFGPAAASSSSTYLLPTLFGQGASSISSTYLLPTLFGPAASSSSFLLPTLTVAGAQGVSSSGVNSGGGDSGGGGGGGGGRSGTTRRNSSSGGSWTTYVPGGSTYVPTGTAVAPAYDTYYQRLAGSALQPAAPLIAMAETVSPAAQSSLSNVFSAQSSGALPTTVAGVSEEVLVTKPLPTGTEALPASGFPYVVAGLLAVIAGFFVLRSVRRMELPSFID